jgi:hypothetical protein
MKRLLPLFCLVMITISASADMGRSDVLLTADGVFYRIDSIAVSDFNADHPEIAVSDESTTILALTIHDGEDARIVPVPASLNGGHNIEPSLAYDPDDNRIYLFWQRKPSPSSSELLLTSYKNGSWSNETTFDNGIWRLRYNLRIAITHLGTTVDEAGNAFLEPAVIAHVVWWEQLGQRESARYAMMNLAGGEVTSLTIRDMSELSSLEEPVEERELPEGFDKSIFRTPYILDVPGNHAIEVLFANWYTNTYELVTVRPVRDEKNGVLHIPTGVTTGVMDAPGLRVRDQNSKLVAVSSPAAYGSKDILIYAADEEVLDYVILRSGEWTESKRIPLNEGISRGEAIQALQRNLSRR